MAFFEKMGQRITNAGQNVAQQTKNLAETTKLNSQISSCEKQINALFATIGQAYYEVSKDDPSAVAAESIQEVTRLYGEIDEAQERIKEIKGVGKCPQCGADVPQGAQFCSACGFKIEVEKPAAKRFCTNCGAPLEADSLFCTSCGQRVAAPAPAPAEEPAAEEPVWEGAPAEEPAEPEQEDVTV